METTWIKKETTLSKSRRSAIWSAVRTYTCSRSEYTGYTNEEGRKVRVKLFTVKVKRRLIARNMFVPRACSEKLQEIISWDHIFRRISSRTAYCYEMNPRFTKLVLVTKLGPEVNSPRSYIWLGIAHISIDQEWPDQSIIMNLFIFEIYNVIKNGVYAINVIVDWEIRRNINRSFQT